jgi:hypothetical protein
MIPPFDIFYTDDDGPRWLESAHTLDDAKLRIQHLGAECPGEYLILSQRTGHKISVTVQQQHEQS